MKNSKLTMIFTLIAAFSAQVLADSENVVTGGYAHTKTAGNSFNGVNFKYGYTPNEMDLGVISSLTVTANGDDDIDRGYGSALVGASYRVNDVLKPYVMIGVGRGAVKEDGDTDTSTGFAYGAGIQVTPISGFTLDAGYEGSKVFGSQVNSVVIGAGWKF
ncbi:outer membrane beta-barrel protein [Citrobacter sp. Igbk 16]|uniref:outer membrane beta-barrel protein n=1 Tax=Citrobacter sp. Igbk 16 TaxID=2963958 RepID=UPI002303188C|nr:outer membrane beta-barrel protein [Citrobacter sp. Igbk 16]MDA8518505.1 outer membrane beta-barrel protein [Citrobacter sp. Igbk 16]